MATLFRATSRSVPFACLACLACMALTVMPHQSAMAQDADAEEQADKVIEEIIVTGTRIKRDSTFTSTSPLAVIDAREAIQFGALEASAILRQSTSVSGQQIDSSFSGFKHDGGPGAEHVALRGLGPERTLVLMDGRRIGAAGMFGAAVHPDLSLIPSFLVDRAEILMSGASSIYGADAVAGVVNIITPRDFEGLQFDTSFASPGTAAGEEKIASIQFGGASDRLRFFLGAEYFERYGVRAEDRSFTRGGNRTIYIDDDGVRQAYPEGYFDQTVAFTPDCFFSAYTPGLQGASSTVPNWSCEGENGVDFLLLPWDNSFAFLPQHIWTPLERWSAFASAEYDLELLSDSVLFFQALTSNRKQANNVGDSQFFPLVPADNIYNPWDADVVPVAFDRDTRSDEGNTAVSYERYVAGLKGDIPFLNRGNMDNWTYEMSLGYTRSRGENQFDIIRNDRLTNSLNNCPNTAQDLFSGFAPECVIVDLFGADFIERGSLGPAHDYLVARVNNTTKTSQVAFELGATGNLFELPAGPVGAFIGTSYRDDTIFSNVDRNIEESNAWGQSAEGDTKGSSDISEIYVELDVPLVSRKKLAEDVAVNLSYRISDDEFFGSKTTWRVTANWDFTDFFRLRSTAGTSFRAPNLKELFIADQTGFRNPFIDPCIPPPNDDRSETVLANCRSEGVDPLTLGATGAIGIRYVSGGADDLRPETSDSWSFGAVFRQPWTDSFDFQMSVDLTNLEIKDAVAQPSAGFILNACYQSPNLSDPLCRRVTRNLDAAPDQRFLLLVDESFANIEIEEYEDLSFSTLFAKDFDMRGRPMTFSWNMDFTNTRTYIKGLFVETADDLVASIGVPEWRAQSAERLGFGNWGISHRVTYFSDGQDTEEQRVNGGYPDYCVNSLGSFNTHSFSLSYDAETWRVFLTLENAFDAEPDLVHSEAFMGNSVNNMPIGVYPAEAIMGRTWIVSISTSF